MKLTIDDKKLLISIYSKLTDSYLYLDGTSCHPTKSIDGISNRAAKRLKQIFSHHNQYSAYLAVRNNKSKEIIRAFENINNQPGAAVQ